MNIFEFKTHLKCVAVTAKVSPTKKCYFTDADLPSDLDSAILAFFQKELCLDIYSLQDFVPLCQAAAEFIAQGLSVKFKKEFHEYLGKDESESIFNEVVERLFTIETETTDDYIQICRITKQVLDMQIGDKEVFFSNIDCIEDVHAEMAYLALKDETSTVYLHNKLFN